MNPTQQEIDILKELFFLWKSRCKINHGDGHFGDWVEFFQKWDYQLNKDHIRYFPNICRLCLTEKTKLIDHHISYFPQWIEFICNTCHELIHHNEIFNGSWVQYTKEDYKKFYLLN